MEKEVEHPNTKYILLTLADNFLDKDEILSLGWKIVTYAEYAKLLRTIIGELKDDEIKEIRPSILNSLRNIAIS